MKLRTKTSKFQQLSLSPRGRIIVVTGARQTGKTTLVKHLFPNYPYISIEDPIMRLDYKELTAKQWQASYPKAILDEVQKEPQLIESIKSVYDQFAETRYILLGSSQLLLLQKIKESLAGRCAIEELFPLTLPELRTETREEKNEYSLFQQLIQNHELPELVPSFHLHPKFAQMAHYFSYYLKFGGYPALVSDEFTDIDRKDWLKGYLRTYLERDVRDLADFKSLDPFIKIQKVCALLTGQLVNYSALAREAGVQGKTAQRFLHYFEMSYQAILLQPWHRNELKRITKSPKLHFLDPGIQRTITGNLEGELTGHEFESALVSEMYKQAKNIGFRGEFYHLRTVDGREVDFLIETEKGYYAFEIKKTSHVNKSDVRHLIDLDEILDKPILQRIILSNDNQVRTFSTNIQAIPAAMFLG
jgi:predicted AAA+ superfamily ATPase